MLFLQQAPEKQYEILQLFVRQFFLSRNTVPVQISVRMKRGYQGIGSMRYFSNSEILRYCK